MIVLKVVLRVVVFQNNDRFLLIFKIRERKYKMLSLFTSCLIDIYFLHVLHYFHHRIQKFIGSLYQKHRLAQRTIPVSTCSLFIS